jgi:hypothetical protein
MDTKPNDLLSYAALGLDATTTEAEVISKRVLEESAPLIDVKVTREVFKNIE